MQRKIRITEPDAINVPFLFKLGDRVRSKPGRSASGRIKDGCFEGEYPSGFYKVSYEIEMENGHSFVADALDLEKL